MLQISEECKQAIDSDFRYIRSYVKVYFDGPELPPVVFTSDDYLIENEILEESSADDENPIGAVSSNEYIFSLNNTDGMFSLTNKDGPYYGRMGEGTKVEVFYEIELPDETWESMLMGTYYTSEWVSDTASLQTDVTCHDRLFLWGPIPMPKMEISTDIALAMYIHKVLQALGFAPEDYRVDPSLAYTMRFAWATDTTFLEWLQLISDGYGCTIYMSRQDRLIIENNRGALIERTTLTDDNQIISISCPQSMLKLYSQVEVQYNRPQLSARKLVLSMKEVTLVPGVNRLENITLQEGPVLCIDCVRLSNGTVADIKRVDYDSWTISIIINSTNPSNEIVDIDVYGYSIEFIEAKHIATNQALYEQIGEKPFQVVSNIIQDGTEAQKYAETLLTIVADPNAYLELELRGNPAIELGDEIIIEDNMNNIFGTYTVYRNNFKYDGAIGCTMSVVKAIQEGGN